MHFVEFEINECYFRQDDYEPTILQARFAEVVQQHKSSDPRHGELLTIAPVDEDLKLEDAGEILVQILHIMPLSVEHDRKKSSLCLHQLTVKTWCLCKQPYSVFFPASTKKYLQPIREQRYRLRKMHLILDKALTMRVLHSHKRGHLALLMHPHNFEQLTDISDELTQSVDDCVNLYGRTVWTGLTTQDALENCEDWHTAMMMRHSIFDMVELAHISLGSAVLDDQLAGLSMVLSSSMDLLFLNEYNDGRKVDDYNDEDAE